MRSKIPAGKIHARRTRHGTILIRGLTVTGQVSLEACVRCKEGLFAISVDIERFD